MMLVVHDEAQQRAVGQGGDRVDHVAEPRGERVGVDAHVEHGRRRAAREPAQRVGLERCDAAGEPEQHLALRGGAARALARDDHVPHLLLQGADPLADRRLGDPQAGGGRAEALLLDHRDEGLQVVPAQHEVILMGDRPFVLALMHRAALASTP